MELRVHESMADIPRAAWDRLVGTGAPPFVSFDFLDVLERAGCITPDRGWLPTHLTLWEGEELVAAAPAYFKGNSEGEFVFDHGWAEFAGRLRLRYYPKLLLAVPFTPATGPRVLVRDEVDRERAVLGMAEGVRRLVDAHGMSSAHVLFPPPEQAAQLERAGFIQRFGMQYQWHNPGYGSFEDFLTAFPSKKRTQIRRERKEMDRQGIRLTTLRGKEITAEAIEAMNRFYELTVDKFRWGRRYLNRAFFFDLCERMPENVEIVLARGASGDILGGAFNLEGGNVLYGRYWGAVDDVPFLHFNVCYYHSIEQCIARKIARFEPGAGGEHKRARGFVPTLTVSAHHLVDGRLSRAVGDYLERERAHVERVIRGEEEDPADR